MTPDRVLAAEGLRKALRALEIAAHGKAWADPRVTDLEAEARAVLAALASGDPSPSLPALETNVRMIVKEMRNPKQRWTVRWWADRLDAALRAAYKIDGAPDEEET